MALEGRSTSVGKVKFRGHPGLLDVHCLDSKGNPRKSASHLFHLPLAWKERDAH